ncbi:helix-turn-helix domain-containing protein [Ekhidna sp.]
MESLLIVGITCSLLLSLLILAKKNKSFADRIFFTWQVALILHFSFLYVRYASLYLDYPHLLALDTSLGLLHIPLLFIYVHTLTNEKHLAWKHLVLHLLPFLVVNILLGVSFYFLSAEAKIAIYTEALQSRKVSITDALIICQSMIYFPIAFQLLGKYNRQIQEKFSTIDEINLRWLQKVSVAFAIGFGLKIVFNLLVFTGVTLAVEFEEATVVVFCFLLLFLGYHGIKSTTIFNQPGPEIKKDVIHRYAKSGLNDVDLIRHIKQVEEYMKSQKPYLNDDLTLAQLAKEVNLSPNNLSQIINQGLKKSFYDFVNEYRVLEVKEKLGSEEYKHIKLLAIAFESGFKSKSTFNAFFKKTVGQTPSEFKDS